jgi:hypothetical protein
MKNAKTEAKGKCKSVELEWGLDIADAVQSELEMLVMDMMRRGS